MLVISRKESELVVLSKDGSVMAEIYVIAIEGSRVKLGFTAGDEVRIIRSELLNKDGADSNGH